MQTNKSGDLHPYVKVSLFQGTGKKHHSHDCVMIEGLRGPQTSAHKVNCRMRIGRGPVFQAAVLILDLPENILGMDILRGQTMDTDSGRYTFGTVIHTLRISAIQLSEGECQVVSSAHPSDSSEHETIPNYWRT